MADPLDRPFCMVLLFATIREWYVAKPPLLATRWKGRGSGQQLDPNIGKTLQPLIVRREATASALDGCRGCGQLQGVAASRHRAGTKIDDLKRWLSAPCADLEDQCKRILLDSVKVTPEDWDYAVAAAMTDGNLSGVAEMVSYLRRPETNQRCRST